MTTITDAPIFETPSNPEARTEPAKFWLVFILFLILMTIAHISANILGVEPEVAAQTGYKRHTVLFYYVIHAIWVTVILLGPALFLHIFSRSDAKNTYWRLFWTFAYLALLTHLYWTVVVTFHGDFQEIFQSGQGQATNPERVIDKPHWDFALAIFWTIDVALAWLVTDDQLWVRVERGALHLFVFAMFFGAFVTDDKSSAAAHALRLAMTIIVISAFAWRIVKKEVDRKSLTWWLFVRGFQLLNRYVRWDRLPTWIAVFNLVAVREVLRAKNLHNTSDIPVTNHAGWRGAVTFDRKLISEREASGQYNDLTKPSMGNAGFNPIDPTNSPEFTLANPGARFGRNIPRSEVHPERGDALVTPSPRRVSELLLARQGKMLEATSLNLLAAAWIQFQVHDWVNHGEPRPIDDDPIKVPLPAGDSWGTGDSARDGDAMLVRRTRDDPTRKQDDKEGPVTYVNSETHWWDNSQIYGDNDETARKYRALKDGKLRTDEATGMLPRDTDGGEEAAVASNWWLGLSLMHNLFTMEHNAICDRIKSAYPDWGDSEIYRVARLVNNALIAKIHTVEWTTAILAHPVLDITMKASWWGLAGETIYKNFGRISDNDMISGQVGSTVKHFGKDFCFTEEFVSVYRLHPLLPDVIKLFNHRNGEEWRTMSFESDAPSDLALGPKAMPNALQEHGDAQPRLSDIVYSFAVQSPGKITLGNYPNWMRRLKRSKGEGHAEMIDLAAIDILRDRERGVPRYNRFRELFHLPRKNSFEDISPKFASKLREVYSSPDEVDLMVGMFAEEPPAGFGFSDTAFRVFILMAGRRITSDRFFTDSFRPEVYTQAGLDWINDNDMRTVLLRHFPDLAPALHGVPNAFAPWRKDNPLGARPARQSAL